MTYIADSMSEFISYKDQDEAQMAGTFDSSFSLNFSASALLVGVLNRLFERKFYSWFVSNEQHDIVLCVRFRGFASSF